MAKMERFRGAETEYGFSAVQIILVLELADAENIYTYPLPEEEIISEESYILAARDLMARGFIENTQEGSLCGLQLTAKARDLFESMIDPVRVVEVISAWSGTVPVLIYRGRGHVCTVSRWDSEGGYIGISLLDCGRIGEWLEEEGFLPGQPFESIREGQKALQYDPQMEESRSRIRGSLVCHPQEPPSLWAIQENVRSAVKSYEISPFMGNGPGMLLSDSLAFVQTAETGADTPCVFTGAGPGSLYVFLETDTESWILSGTDRKGTAKKGTGSGSEERARFDENTFAEAGQDWSIEPDSLEYREKIWRNIL